MAVPSQSAATMVPYRHGSRSYTTPSSNEIPLQRSSHSAEVLNHLPLIRMPFFCFLSAPSATKFFALCALRGMGARESTATLNYRSLRKSSSMTSSLILTGGLLHVGRLDCMRSSRVTDIFSAEICWVNRVFFLSSFLPFSLFLVMSVRSSFFRLMSSIVYRI